MKQRLTKQIEQINQFLAIFRSSKAKCGRLIAKLDLDVDFISEYENIEKLFKIDLNLLDLAHLADRKQKLTRSIDQLAKLESDLSLQAIKQAEIEQAEYQSFSFKSFQQHIHNKDQRVTLEKEVKEPAGDTVQTTNKKRISHKRRSAECQVAVPSRCGELYNVWAKNRSSANQSIEDRFDRLSKIIGILKKNAKEIYQQQKQRNDALVLEQSDDFDEIKKELYNLKRENINLKNINSLLSTQATPSTASPAQSPVPKQSRESQTDNLLIHEDNFSRITDVYNPCTQFSIDASRQEHYSLEESIVKRVKLVEESIGGRIELAEESILYHNKHLSTDSDEEQREENKEVLTLGVLTFNKKVMNQIQSNKQGVKQLLNVGTKLREIKQNRRRVADDDVWSQMENMQL